MSAESPYVSETYQQVFAPSWPLWLAAFANVLSIALIVWGDVLLAPVPRHIAGWAASSLLGFALVVYHQREEDRLAYEEPRFSRRPGQHTIGTVLLVAGIALCALHSWWFATELAS